MNHDRHQTLNPLSRMHCLWASIKSWQPSSPLSMILHDEKKKRISFFKWKNKTLKHSNNLHTLNTQTFLCWRNSIPLLEKLYYSVAKNIILVCTFVFILMSRTRAVLIIDISKESQSNVLLKMFIGTVFKTVTLLNHRIQRCLSREGNNKKFNV